MVVEEEEEEEEERHVISCFEGEMEVAFEFNRIESEGRRSASCFIRDPIPFLGSVA